MSSQDQRFMDFFSLVIGTLVAIAVALVFIALKLGSPVQTQGVQENPAYAALVNERLQPAGRVALPGDAPEPSAAAAAPTPVSAPLSGPQVFNQACNACHGAGIGGAPKLGDKAAWAPRIAQGSGTLNKHALEGFQGQAGFMPPKGGWVNLSDGEIIAAVEYMVGAAK